MAEFSLPTVSGDENTWGAELNGTLQYLKDAQELLSVQLGVVSQLATSMADGVNGMSSTLAAGFVPIEGALELQPLRIIAHSWGAVDTNATPGTRWFQRMASRLRMGTVTNTSVSGRTIGDLTNLSLSGANAWVPRTKALTALIGTINDVTIFDGSVAARTGYGHAWRALLSQVTANGYTAANTATFAYGPTWTSEAVSGTSADPAGATANSTGGTRWKTTTVGDQATFRFNGTGADVFLVARAAGAGVVSVKEGLTTLGTIDLTAPTAQDVPAVFRIRALAVGDHTITVELVSGASVTIDSVRIPSTAPVPVLVLGEPTVVPAPTDQASYLADVAVLKADLAAICAEFPTVIYVDLDTPDWDPATMLVTDSNGGHKHPNDKGCAFIAAKTSAALAANAEYLTGLNITDSPDGYPAAYAAPAPPGIPYSGQDGTTHPGLTALFDTNTSIALDWTRLAEPAGVTDHQVRYRIGAGAWTTVNTSSASQAYVVTGLVNGTTYGFQVAPVVSGVTGTWSKEVLRLAGVGVASGYASRYIASDDPTAAGVAVTTWADTGPAAVNWTGTNGPTKRTSPFHYMEFDGTNDGLSRTRPANPKTVFVVAKRRATGTQAIMGTGANSTETLQSTSGNLWALNNGTVLSGSAADLNWHVFHFVIPGDGTGVLGVDGLAEVSGSIGSFTDATQWLGRTGSTVTYGQVDIAQVIEYTSVLPQAQRSETNQALRNAYAI